MDSSKGPQMHNCDIESELFERPAESSADVENRKDQQNHDKGSDVHTSEDNNSFFQDTIGCAPSRTRRMSRDKGRTLHSLSAFYWSSDASDYEPKKISDEIAEYLKNPFRRKWTRKKRRRSIKRYLGIKRTWKKGHKGKPAYSIPREERKRRLRDRGIQFSFTPTKHLSFKQYFSYEQFVLGGFMNHLEDIKYERKLKKSLDNMQMGEDLENENFHMRKYLYLDEDGPLSPISEPG
ncbi:hypothetical protein GDO81_005672 [Engystomops pustulosus]|uniref:TATA box-binding protein-associated factor RNA polymerase I subunit D n=1 Tax=Engystomops pustulosus TaxID=76066 RepID=A0AAV7CQV7_ENGPU|nr:hypothetical protein GDO81_005672 [Engystomops pustulosus]KAG8587470.1 hypothetical protein GDO81_005672 [Engystomops pustulosus]